ncbi:MAG: carboxypeptidase-like regulatory domain-containing protein [Planctomycetota bacterium]|jgi:hypothetical protein
MPAALLLLALSGTIRVSVEGDATEVVAYHRGQPVARAAVTDGVAVLRDLPVATVDVVALGDATRSDVVRQVRPVEGGNGFDARLRARPCHRLVVKTEQDAVVHVGGVRFPASRVLLHAGLHRLIVDHPERVSSAARLVRITKDSEIEVPLDTGLVVAGMISGADGRPLAGAKIDVYADGYPTRRTATSAANGRFAVAGFRGYTVSLRVTATQHATRLHRVVFDPGSERATVELKLARGASVSFPVEGPASGAIRATLLPRWLDAALEEPRLKVNDEPNRVRAREGRVQFDGLLPDREYRVLVEAQGYLPASSGLFRAGAQAEGEPIRLVRGATITGTLKGPPLTAGVTGPMVVARGRFGDRVSRVDRNGAFSFDGLPEGKVLLILRDVDERGTLVEVKGRGDIGVVLPYELPPDERVLEGTVIDADREPLADVLVTAGGRRAVTDAEGAFRLGPMALGRDRFVVRLEPLPKSPAFFDDPHLPRLESKVRIGFRMRAQLERAGSLHVRWPESRLARATLLLAGTSGAKQIWRIPRGATEMRIDEIPVGSYVVEVGAPGYLGTGGAVVPVVPVTAKTGAASEITLLRGRSTTGKVVSRRGIFREGRPPHILDEPIRRGTVSLYDLTDRLALAHAPLAEDGTFVLEGLPAAPVLLVAAAPGWPVTAVRVDLTSKDSEDLTIPLFHALAGGVRVTGPGERALPQARVAIRTQYGIDLRDLIARGRFHGIVADDADKAEVRPLFRMERRKEGLIIYKRLGPGNYEFRVTAPGHKPGRAKIRAREPWTVAHIGTLVPGLDPTPIVPVRLAQVPIEKREQKPEQNPEQNPQEMSGGD